MEGLKISQFPATNTLGDNDIIPVVQASNNKKIIIKDLISNIINKSTTVSELQTGIKELEQILYAVLNELDYIESKLNA